MALFYLVPLRGEVVVDETEGYSPSIGNSPRSLEVSGCSSLDVLGGCAPASNDSAFPGYWKRVSASLQLMPQPFDRGVQRGAKG
jgi:hypothetical protein